MGDFQLSRDLLLRRKRSLERTEFLLSSAIFLPVGTRFFKAEIRVKNAPPTWNLGARINWLVGVDNGWARINGTETEDIRINSPEVFVVPPIVRIPVFRLDIPYWIESARFYLWEYSNTLTEDDSMSFYAPLVFPTEVSPFRPDSGSSLSNAVAVSVTSVELLAANSGRKGFLIRNKSTQALYVDFAATATISNSPIKIEPNGIYESSLVYTGVVSGIWDGADQGGSALSIEVSEPQSVSS